MKNIFTHIAMCFLPAISLANSPTASPVEVTEVESKFVDLVVWVPGTVISRQDSKIASEITGVLSQVAEVGEYIKKGQSLAKINDRSLHLQLRLNMSEIIRLETRLQFTKTQLARSESLAQSSSTAQFRIDEGIMNRDVLIQELEAAKVKLAQTQYDIERAKIKAPFDGVVVERLHHLGEHIAIGEELVRLVNANAVEISAKAPITMNHFLKPKHQVNIKTAEKNTIGTLRTIVPVGDARSRMLELRLTPAEDEHGPRIVGEAVKVALTRGEKVRSLVVPRDALVLRNNAVYVYRVNTENKVDKIEVITEVGHGSDITVRGDLSEGDLIVTRGAERLQNGSPVRMIKKIAER